MEKKFKTCDGNTAAATIAYAFSEVAAIYPITPSSSMGELADAWSANGKKNLFEMPVRVQEMQSEGGAAGAIHGSLTGGALTTTFTASQGLLLMLPNMFKIAGEMLPTVFHVASRSLAYQSLSIFCDHSDVMAARGTGFAFLSSSSVQEAQDMAVISHLSTLKSKVPFVHFFDGFRTSSEIQKIEELDTDILYSMIDMKYIEEFRTRGIRPEAPYVKVGAQNPDVYFQGRESVNKYYDATPNIVQEYMDLFFQKFGRKYDLFDYKGAPDAEKIIISMGSSTETIEETLKVLIDRGEKVGAINVRLYRPFSADAFVDLIPETVKKIAVLDRTKECGSTGEPLYLDVVSALNQKDITNVKIIGGRYGLSSKEFTPSMVNAIYKHMDEKCFHNFTVGIEDDVTYRSIPVEEFIDAEPKGTIRCKFWGYGSDGTVSANKSAIKIIGDNTDMHVQGYFSYDSKKSGGITISHLRFGNHPIQSEYLLEESDLVALHKPSYIGRYHILKGLIRGGTFLINCSWKPENVFENLTKRMQEYIVKNEIKVYCIDAFKIAEEAGIHGKISTIMEAVFFKLAGVMDSDVAIEKIKEMVAKQFKSKGQDVIEMNYAVIDKALDNLNEAIIPKGEGHSFNELKLIPDNSSDFVKYVVEPIMRHEGDDIPVSQIPFDGVVPVGTAAIEKRSVAETMPLWKSEHCIQCAQCAFVCPHAAIRVKQMEEVNLADMPKDFVTLDSTSKSEMHLKFKVQVYPEDCVGCGICADVCPTKEKSLVMVPAEEIRTESEIANQKFFEALPDDLIDGVPEYSIKGTQFKKPLFEFSGACAGCGETPFIKLATQMYGDRMIIANATGCSSIFGGTFPTVPYCTNSEGKGPAWANSLFEDNAEYGYGMRLAVDQNRAQLKHNLEKLLITGTTDELKEAIEKMLSIWDNVDDVAKAIAKGVLIHLPKALETVYGESKPILEKINELKDYLIDKSVWIIGGDGWAYDIGFGGLDHVLAQGKNVNVLVLDTEVYSNTGGQSSKATPRGATAKFATAGKETPKKNLGMMMMSYGNVYVASVDMGANRPQVIKAFREAEEYDGPSIIIAYSPCIAHGYKLHFAEQHGKAAMQSGYWPIYRYDPRLEKEGKNPMQWETPVPSVPFNDYVMSEGRYKALTINFPEESVKLFKLAEEDAIERHKIYKKMAGIEDKKEESTKQEE